MADRPQGREKHVAGTGNQINTQGSGLHTGPVGHSSSQSRPTGQGRPAAQRPAGQYSRPAQQQSGTRASGGGSPLLKIIIAAVVLLGGGGFGLSSLLGGGGEPADTPSSSYTQPYTQSTPAGQGGYSQGGSQGNYGGQSSQGGIGSLGQTINIGSLLSPSVGSVSSGWTGSTNAGKLNTGVDPAAREKYTQILGGGKDTVTIMVYMCGSDLESKSGMATSDLAEMAAAKLSDKVNIIVYTGGATAWKNNVVSSRVNQIYKVESGGLRTLVSDDGTAAMTNPDTLSSFIQYCTKNYPANRNELIFWDHGGGSISGYGYDEKNPRSGSMGLSSISKALKAGGTKFDFIGFDACLMGTLENGLTLAPYADYLIASEETEPGIGWYYTDWLTSLSANTSLSTLEIGKAIVDDFVATCDRKCAGQKTTLSVVDLAELEKTVPAKFKNFASGLSGMLQNSEFTAVTNARNDSREFATSSKVDMVDLVDLANHLGTAESKALASTLLSAVKYNRTSSSITNAYGISIYFPYQKKDRVGSAVSAYNALGLDSEYTRCIQQFASVQGAGQSIASAGSGVGSPLGSLMGGGSGSMVSSDLISGLLGSFLGGGGSFGLGDRDLNTDALTAYLKENRFDPAELVWQSYNGAAVMALSEANWKMVHDLSLSVWLDNGSGYIDLGLDNVFDFTDEGYLKGEYDGTWLAIDNQPVAYYYEDTVTEGDSYVITGYVPVLLNGSRAELILIFDSAHPYGFIAGARSVYTDGETDTVSKGTDGLVPGEDVIQYIADFYSYSGSYQDSYLISDPIVYTGEEQISNVYITGSGTPNACYLFTDLYNQEYWTPVIP